MSNATPQVTTILTTYRRPKLLQRAIRSVLQQTFREVRVLVLDDASNDETEQVVRALAAADPRVQYVRHESNIGMTPNWRYGLEHVETPYFSFLSDDDMHLPGFYENALKALENNPAVGFYCGTTLILGHDGNLSGVSTDGWTEGVYHPYDGMLRMMQQPPNWDGVLFRKAVFEKVGTLSDIYGTDYDFLVRASRCCSFLVTHEACALFRSHREQGYVASVSKRKQILHETCQMATELLGASNLPPEIRAAAWPLMNAKVFAAAKHLCLSHWINCQPEDALETAYYLNRIFPGSSKAYKFILLAQMARRLPWASSMIRTRLLNHKPRPGRRQDQSQACYGRWVSYASELQSGLAPSETLRG